jgi:succinate dehydrogenase/fumarate reductase flavoprotein subunit
MALNVIPVETDVLVIGGGLAGCMAAIKATESGLSVTIAEKANTAHSGCAGSGIDHAWGYVPPVHEKMGWKIEDMLDDHIQAYSFVNKDLFYLVAGTMYDRMLDLEKFGLKFRFDDSKIPGKFRLVPQFHSVPDTFNFEGREIKKRLTEEAQRRGVKIINRVMVTDLLSTDGHVSGALGVQTRTSDIYSLRAKAIVLTTGRSTRLSRNVTGIDFDLRVPGSLSGDGKAMALREGADLANMELLAPGGVMVRNYHQTGGPAGGMATWHPASDVINAKGDVVYQRAYFFDFEHYFKEKIDAAEQRRKWLEELPRHWPGLTRDEYIKAGPLYGGCSADATDYEIEYIRWSNSNEGKCYLWSKHHLDEEMKFDWKKDRVELGPRHRELAGTSAAGVVVNKNLETTLKGLFAAGDEVAGLPWSASPGAIAMGWHAGDMAARHAKEADDLLPVNEERLNNLKELCSGMMKAAEGFYWKEVELAVQNIMDLNCGDIRTEPMLKRGIALLQEMKEAPMKADNPHELARCLEVKSIIDNAEMVTSASLERTESRNRPVPFHRADYPEQDDENWLAFLALRKKKGEFTFSKIPIKGK